MSRDLQLGRGTVVTIAPLKLGSRVEPAKGNVTTGATLTAKAATSITILSLPVALIAGTYLGFVDLVTGSSVTVRLTADAAVAATTLTVASTPSEIAANSVAEFPLILIKRSGADLQLSGNLASQISLEDGGWETGIVASFTGSLSLSGAYVELDPAYNVVRDLFLQSRKLFVTIEYVPPSFEYSKGRIIKGVFSIVTIPVSAPANGFIQGDITLQLDGQPIFVAPVPTA